MQKYYINKDDQQQGPFTIEELANLKISRDTMVWHEGIDHWKKAYEVAELEHILKKIPPPLQTDLNKTPPPLETTKTIQENKNQTITKPKKKNITTILVVSLLIGIIGIGMVLFANQKAEQAAIEQKLDEENTKILEQEKIEAARQAEIERQRKAALIAKRNAELTDLRNQFDQTVTSLRAAKLKLEDIQQFHFLRTEAEKEGEVEAQLEIIRQLENEVDRLKKEIEKY
jgi:hypothetical protein